MTISFWQERSDSTTALQGSPVSLRCVSALVFAAPGLKISLFLPVGTSLGGKSIGISIFSLLNLRGQKKRSQGCQFQNGKATQPVNRSSRAEACGALCRVGGCH